MENQQNKVDDSVKFVHKLEKKQKSHALFESIIPLTAHISGLVTIFCAYYIKDSHLQFNINNVIDWVIAFIIIFILVSGIVLIAKAMKNQSAYIVDRNELHHLMTVAREAAQENIVSISGDLSWLNEEKKSIEDLLSRKKNLVYKIFYDSTHIGNQTEQDINELKLVGVNFIPNRGLISNCAKFMAVDYHSTDNIKLYFYPKNHESKNLTNKTCNYKWHVYTKEDEIMVNNSISLINVLENLNTIQKNNIKIGVMGINNIGKTKFTNKLQSRIKTMYPKISVIKFDDEFDKYRRTDDITNTLILNNQLMNERISNYDICLYDRTSVDNYFCFTNRIQMSIQHDKVKMERLDMAKMFYKHVIESMLRYDIIVLLRNNNNFKKTTYLSSDMRKAIYNDIQDYYDNLSECRKIVVNIKNSTFDNDLDNGVIEVINLVEQISKAKNLTIAST